MSDDLILIIFTHCFCTGIWYRALQVFTSSTVAWITLLADVVAVIMFSIFSGINVSKIFFKICSSDLAPQCYDFIVVEMASTEQSCVPTITELG